MQKQPSYKEITAIIRDNAGGSHPGDGVIAVLPVDSFEYIHETEASSHE